MWYTPSLYSVWKRVQPVVLLASLFSEKREDLLDTVLQTHSFSAVGHANFNEEIVPSELSRVSGTGHSQERLCKI